MFKRILTLLAAPLTAILAGCSMCQDFLDGTGPVPDAPNYGDYYHSPRVGSNVGHPVGHEEMAAEPTLAPPAE